MNHFINISALFLSAALFLQSCENKSPDSLESLLKEKQEIEEKIAILQKNDTTVKSKVKYVEIEELKPSTFFHYIEVQGIADTDQNLLLTARASGTVEKVHVKEGSKVRKGETLVRIDDGMILNSIQEVNTSLSFAREVYEKQKALWEQKIGSEISYLEAKNNKDALENKLSTLREQLSMTRVTAPIDGIIDNVMIRSGELAAPGAPLLRLVNLSHFEIKASVAENHSLSVRNGTKVSVWFPDLNNEILSEIGYTGQVIDPVDRTFNVVIRVKNPEIPVKPNMVAVVKILDYKADSTLIIPVNTIQKSTRESYVFVGVEENGVYVARKRVIVPGYNYKGMTEIREGLKPMDKLISFGFQDLIDGQIIEF